MDINGLYFKHQVSMMQASSTEDACDRTYHQTIAEALAQRIAKIHQDSGAGAAAYWMPGASALAIAAVAEPNTVCKSR